MENHEPDWSYSGRTGPEHWGTLDESFRLCGEGERQSPVDLRTPVVRADEPPLRITEEPLEGTLNQLPTGVKFHTDPPTTMVEWRGKNYSLEEFHFHAPSEHTLDGKPLPMESHFVHRDEEGNLLVLGVFLEGGDPSGGWETLRKRMFQRQEDPFVFSPGEFLPDPDPCFAYDGSLTTPPCDQGVQWVLLVNTVGVDAEWIESFRSRYGPNNRPLQERNGRTIYRYSTTGEA